MAEFSFFAELRKRRVLQAAAIYGAIAWGVTEVVVTVVEQLFLPQWVSTLAVIFFVVGFPVAMFLSWTFDFTSEGIRRTTVTTRRGTATIVASLMLLLAGTAGLFFLIRPDIKAQQMTEAPTAVPTQPNSLAILPFATTGGTPENAYLVDGLSDALRDQLARVSGLRVAARSSSIAVIEQQLDALATSSRLGVSYLIEGTVRWEGDSIVVSVQLIDGKTGLADWSETYARGTREILLVQQSIAEAIVANVLPEAKVAVAEPATRDASANELMLLARYYENEVREREVFNENSLLESIRLYREASEADPESALAHSRLAGVLMYGGQLDAAEAHIFRALSINANLSEVQNTVGQFHYARGLVDKAGEAWQRAVELNPNNPEALTNYAQWSWPRGQIERPRELFKHALELDPLNLERYASLGIFLASENFYDEARELVGRIEELFKGAPSFRLMAQLLDRLGEVDRSIAWTIRARDLEPENPDHVWRLAEYYADIGVYETALRLDPDGIGILFKMRRFEEVIDLAELAMIDQPDDLWIRTILAMSYNAVGKYESAIRVLGDTGVVESVFNGWRTYAEFYAYQTLQNAHYAIGELEYAQELARFVSEETAVTQSFHFFVTLRTACSRAILGQDDLARRALRRAQKGLYLIPNPYLKDLPCFDRFKDDPVYQDTVRYFDNMRKEMRERLPATLEEFGVSL